jgi:hypothetical protein
MSSRAVYWTCESCGRLTDGGPGMDDAMDCFCRRCRGCGELEKDCLCEDVDVYFYGDDYGDDWDYQ